MPGQALLRRMSWSLADQVLASLTNFGLTVLVARSVAPHQFGVFSIVMAAYILVAYLSRGLTADPLVTRYSTAARPAWAGAVRASTAATALVGLFLAAAVAVLSPFLPAGPRMLSLAFAVVLPGVLMQDHLRFAFFTEGRPGKAFANDLLWAATQFSAIAVVVNSGVHAVPPLILLWGGSGTIAALVGLAQLRQLPAPSRVRWWFAEHRELWRPYAVENSLLQVTNLVVLAVVGAVAGLAAAGSLRAAVAVFGPLTILALGALAGGVPELARVARRDVDRMRRYALLLGCVLAAATVLWGLAVLLLPMSAGHALFGQTWTLARPILVFTLIDAVGALFVIGPFAGLRALGSGRRSLRIRAAFSVVRLVIACAGALAGGLHGAVLAFAVMAPVQMIGWWWQFTRACARPARVDPDPVASYVASP